MQSGANQKPLTWKDAIFFYRNDVKHSPYNLLHLPPKDIKYILDYSTPYR